ncbi:hypothetical protein LAZ67_1001310 [Cordylochernes scorpioides]|uniref:Uncharacterized protein n=1 Tax=Cordylochernes scorpioides TaxID=51811 RepID=A0ABY6JWC7_9ARAC|nr:hypothetical protein LAZ67_1001310 [Cordylochernes scorpioides]
MERRCEPLGSDPAEKIDSGDTFHPGTYRSYTRLAASLLTLYRMRWKLVTFKITLTRTRKSVALQFTWSYHW